MAVSNSAAHSVSLYARGDTPNANYGPQPCCTISDPSTLDYVHDVSFLPCGGGLLAVAREAHSLSMFTLRKMGSKGPMATPLWSVRGRECGLHFPAGIAIHPSGNWLAVANRMHNGITLYRNSGSKNQFDSTPFQAVTEDDLSTQGLAAPHGLDFSPDGEFLIVAHKRFYKTEHPKGDSALSVFRCKSAPDLGVDPKPIFIHSTGRAPLHHAAFHPSGKIVAVVDESAGVDLFDWKPEQMAMIRRDRVSLFHAGRAPKGAAFAKEGEHLVVSTEWDEVLFFKIAAP